MRLQYNISLSVIKLLPVHCFESVSALSCFILECTALWDLFPHSLNSALSESCIIIIVMTPGCYYYVFINIICTSIWSAP